MGISFYTFQIIAYQVDVAKGRTPLIREFPQFALFITFFPQLIAGPIVRARTMMPQMKPMWERRRRRTPLISLGLSLCALGLVKKIVFSDSLAPTVDDIFALGPADPLTAWLGAWLFGFRAYFDFSGYSDIAVGTAYLLGFRVPQNFRQPFLARTPYDFWRRWHITLYNWMRIYLFMPLIGRNVDKPVRNAVIIIGVMSLMGFWHGAAWQFIIFGALWGVYMSSWQYIGPLVGRLGPVSWLPHIAVVTWLWVLFRAADIGSALDYTATMFGGAPAGGYSVVGTTAETSLIVLGAAALMVLHWLEAQAFLRASPRFFRRIEGPLLWGVLLAICGWLVMMPKPLANPFIYFRF